MFLHLLLELNVHLCLGIYLGQLEAYPRVGRWMCMTQRETEGQPRVTSL